ILCPPRRLREGLTSFLTIGEIGEAPQMDDLIERTNFRIKVSDQVSQDLGLDRQALRFVDTQTIRYGTALHRVGAQFDDHVVAPAVAASLSAESPQRRINSMRRIQHSGPAHARTSGGRDNLSTLKDFAAGRLEPMRC